MKRKIYSNLAKSIAGGIAIFGISVSGNTFAAERSKDIHKPAVEATKERHPVQKEGVGKELDWFNGWKLSSTGGLSYVHPDSDCYWFKLSGILRIDETVFMGDYRDKGRNFPSGAHMKAVDFYVDGGIGKNWEYTVAYEFDGHEFHFGDTWLSYMGVCDNNQIFVGNVPGTWFGLDNANSTTWNPFLERSIQTTAFYLFHGLGVMTDFWWDNGGITFVASQPRPNYPEVYPETATIGTDHLARRSIRDKRDRWTGIVRATFAPVHDLGNVWHFGMSGAWREFVTQENGVPVSLVQFSTTPEGRARNTGRLVNTGFIRANNARYFNVEAARQCGPAMLEGEYTNVYVHRIGDNQGTVRFYGWNLQGRYLLTGEAHEYDVRDGNFSTVTPCSPCGAVEIAARYDFLNLNDKNVRGGSEHNATLGLNWFVNKQVRLSANYVYAVIHPRNDGLTRYLNIIGLRAQVRFK